MSRPRRVFILVMDSAGIGHAPDAQAFGDAGSNTLSHIDQAGGLELPTLFGLGLGALLDHDGALPPSRSPRRGAYGRMTERSPGKDTPTGHWEMAGLVLERDFPLYPQGFPAEVMRDFEAATGRGWLWNRPASGTEIIQRFGDEQVATGKLIVYTSGDSVFQIAAHEDVVPLTELYDICARARALLRGPHEVGRVIARPFVGRSGAYTRTANRRDWAVPPFGPTLLDHLKAAGLAVRAVGKIEDIFAGRGITEALHPKGNDELMAETHRLLREDPRPGLVFTNLVDFDTLYGHRRDPQGYRGALQAFDEQLERFIGDLSSDDLLFISADHGCDPTFPGSDHTREQVPVLAYRPGLSPIDLGTRESFADLGQTIAENFGLRTSHGRSFRDRLTGKP